jgi:tRNA (cmo5U34)-methyltransferase
MLVKTLFDKAAQSYDQSRRQLVPCFDDFYGTVLELIPFDRQAPLQLLDLGAGTGLLSALVAEVYPQAEITLVDISEAMLNKARERFAAQKARFRFLALDLAQAALPGQYHGVMSALSIHHLPHEAKQALFREIYHKLLPGGIFINADQVLGPTPELEQAYKAAWRRQVRARGVSEATLAAALERMKEDQEAPLADQLAWLSEAGFQQAHCYYQHYFFAVYAGYKL